MGETFAKRPINQGKNIQKFRLIRGISQMGMAVDSGRKNETAI